MLIPISLLGVIPNLMCIDINICFYLHQSDTICVIRIYNTKTEYI
ncbi:Hypothetical protein ETEE_2715 [Edwardsiella anguillarum ET080813]|uniref:Uncharacterized protein n=1 Tax=Edwardsiella anguillarum ET080813 TaxID=667120 RepID=A0A076LRH0_9GAMM|nr:Hypothetical protein ETEE_2715 [Edwardsiella anguillarum ET080813]